VVCVSAYKDNKFDERMQEFSNIFFSALLFRHLQNQSFFQTKQDIEDLFLNLILVVDVWSKITVSTIRPHRAFHSPSMF